MQTKDGKYGDDLRRVRLPLSTTEHARLQYASDQLGISVVDLLQLIAQHARETGGMLREDRARVVEVELSDESCDAMLEASAQLGTTFEGFFWQSVGRLEEVLLHTLKIEPQIVEDRVRRCQHEGRPWRSKT